MGSISIGSSSADTASYSKRLNVCYLRCDLTITNTEKSVAGIEPAPVAWKATILAVIRYRHLSKGRLTTPLTIAVVLASEGLTTHRLR